MTSDLPATPAAEVSNGTMNSLGKTLGSVIDVGRELLAKRKLAIPAKANPAQSLLAMCAELLNHRGEASGLALASDIAQRYLELPEDNRLEFFNGIASDFDVDNQGILDAADAYRENPSLENLHSVSRAVEAPRQKLFRRINMAPNGTATLVAMRGHLLDQVGGEPGLKAVDSDLRHLFVSWFNKGFLELRRIDWTSPAFVLEKIIHYEAVHAINGWDDLRNRLGEDRRCFAFFHPSLENDPLVFVEIALTADIPDAMPPLLAQDREALPHEQAKTVVFYSISNCHPGLAGITFGNFLIKNVVEELKNEMPWLKTFVTLSPVPGFRKWLLQADLEDLLGDKKLAEKMRHPVGQVVGTDVHEAHIKLCAYYLLNAKNGELPLDPVARFHLGNGAQLHRLHDNADLSVKGREQSAGIMVNYLYDLGKIEENHEAYFDEGKIAVSKSVTRLID